MRLIANCNPISKLWKNEFFFAYKKMIWNVNWKFCSSRLMYFSRIGSTGSTSVNVFPTFATYVQSNGGTGTNIDGTNNYHSVFTASAQNFFGRFFSNNKHLVISIKVRFFLSLTPFLLRCVRSGKLMYYTLAAAKFFEF